MSQYDLIEDYAVIDSERWAADLDERLAAFEQVRQELKACQAIGDVDNGLVAVRVDGDAEIQEIRIDLEAMEQGDPMLLEDLLMEAIGKAYSKIGEIVEAKSVELRSVGAVEESTTDFR